jgi:hypothetical protein
MQVQTIPPTGAKWHMLAYSTTLAVTTGYQTLQALNDPVFTVKGTNYQNPYNLGCFAAYAQNATAVRARINTPSLRLRGFPLITPLVVGAAPPANPNWLDMFDHPIYLRPDEDIEVDLDNGGVATQATAFLWVYYAADMVPQVIANVNAQDLRWVRATATLTTAAAFAWSGPAALTFDDTLEGGSYDVYGAECFGATSIGFRLWFQNQYWKPGSFAFAAVGSRQPYPWYEQRMGFWGNFNTYSLPMIEVIATTAAAQAPIVNLLIGKTSQQFRGLTQ